ncbi:MAG: hypothetical protein EBR81_12815 [Proteobacteria bacterium]|nr:hypothetical protein [Pseudomonadota bacterium]
MHPVFLCFWLKFQNRWIPQIPNQHFAPQCAQGFEVGLRPTSGEVVDADNSNAVAMFEKRACYGGVRAMAAPAKPQIPVMRTRMRLRTWTLRT